MIPSAESPADQDDLKQLLGHLNDEYDRYDRSKGLGSDRDPVLLFGKSVGGYGVLCRCGPTRYEDAMGRTIYALSGLLARHEEKKEFAAALPYLVALEDAWLDIPIDLGAADTDHVKNSVHTQSIALDRLRDELPATAQEWLRLPHVQGLTADELRSDGDGVKCLLRLLGSPLVPWIDFAFATPARLARRMGTFDVVVGDVGLSVSGADRVTATRVSSPVPARAKTGGQPAPDGRARGARRRDDTESTRRTPSGRKRAASKTVFDSGGDSRRTKKTPSEQRGRRITPVLPDDADPDPHADPVGDGDAVRIRAVTDSSYLERMLHRIYFRFEAYEASGYVAAESERFRLSLNLQRDHVVQREALHGLLSDLHDRGYVPVDDRDRDWSECVLRRARRGSARPDR